MKDVEAIKRALLRHKAELRERFKVKEIGVFGSYVRGEQKRGSDVDVLVEFEPGHVPGLIRLAGMEFELSEILGGRRVDMNTPQCLSRYFRDRVQAEAQVQYVQP